ncbi:methionyl-tRNA formyltransferase [Luminiphilus sp.]|nr:methionyl-tRNA formyltransferase [Luminiphilus sp.]MDA8985667.1 methionyl-tRNA formyltransferase [Luminiphilus sp.]
MTSPLNIIFAGTPEFAAAHLTYLIKGPHRIVAVLTQPDRRAGRGKRLQPSAVKSVALAAGIPLWQPDTLKDPASEAQLASYGADVMIVVAYGLMLPAGILAIPRIGCINVHASLLPRWRGAAPVQRAIEAGDRKTGVSIMMMEPGLDTGPVLLRREVTITGDHTAGTLLADLEGVGTQALTDCLMDIASRLLTAQVQDEQQVTYARKIDKAETAIDWSLSAVDIDRKVRALLPSPGCYTLLNGDRFKVWAAHALHQSHGAATGEIMSAHSDGLSVACGKGVLVITEAQMPGGTPQTVTTLLNGHQDKLTPGKRFAFAGQVDHV